MVQRRVPPWTVEQGARMGLTMCHQGMLFGSLRTLSECKQALDIPIMAPAQDQEEEHHRGLEHGPREMRAVTVHVCGSGGARPKHAALLATDIDEESCLKYSDRF